MIEQTITIGNIIEIGVFALTGIAFVVRQNTNINYMKKELTSMQTEIKSLSGVVTLMAVATNRIENVEQDIRELKHGRGFVKEAWEKDKPRS